MTKFYAQEKRVFDINKVTVVGTPTITEAGVASGFVTSNSYLSKSLNLQNISNLEVITCVSCSEISSTYQYLFSLRESSSVLVCEASINSSGELKFAARGGTTLTVASPITLNQKYFLKYQFNKGSITLSYSLNGKDWIVGNTSNASCTTVNAITWYLGGAAGGIYAATNCNLYLPDYSIIVDGKEVYSPTKPVYSLERRKEGFDLSKFTVVGSPNITEAGVASGFSVNQDCLKTQINFSNIDSFNILGSFYRDNTTTTGLHQTIFELWDSTNSRLRLALYNPSTSRDNLVMQYPTSATSESTTAFYSFTLNQWHSYEIKYNSGILNLYVDGIKKTNDIVVDKSWLKYFYELWIGASHNAAPYSKGFLGSIDLTQFSITVDGKEVFTGAKEKFYAMRGM